MRWLLASLLALSEPAAPRDEPAAASTERARDRVAVAPIELRGETEIEQREQLEAALIEGLRRAGFAVVALDAGAAADCASSASGCSQRARDELGATHLLRTRVVVAERDYGVTLELASVDDDARERVSQEDECSICGLEEVRVMLAAQGPQLRGQLDARREQARLEEERQRRLAAQRDALARQPVIVVHSAPAGALVTIDGEVAGHTPLERRSTAGAHVVAVSLAGHVPEEREIVLERGVTQRLDITLRSGRLPPTAFSRQLLITGSVSVSLGVAALGVMASGLSLGRAAERDGERLVDAGVAAGNTGIELTDALADTRHRGRQGNTLAIAGGVVAGVLLTAGAALIGVSTTDRARRVASTVNLAAGPGSWGLSLSGRF